MSIERSILEIKKNIEVATAKQIKYLGNKPEKFKLVAVTKNHPVSAMQQAIDASITAIGENRIQEAVSKYPVLDRKAEWHLIGHLQTNKARQAVQLFDLIHSIDSEKLASEVNRAATRINKCQDVLIQVNAAGEETKFGINATEKEVMSLARFISNLQNIRLCGLMTIAPYSDNPEITRPFFRELYQLFCELRNAKLPNTNIEWLSMGMTNDYIVAIEEGANLVRIGTGIFGNREYS